MKNPKEVYGVVAYIDFMSNVKNIDDGLFKLLNDADDLELSDEEQRILYRASEITNRIFTPFVGIIHNNWNR